jgi:hypothetical protein
MFRKASRRARQELSAQLANCSSERRVVDIVFWIVADLANPPTPQLLHPESGRKWTPIRSEDRTLGGQAAICLAPQSEVQRGEAGALRAG